MQALRIGLLVVCAQIGGQDEVKRAAPLQLQQPRMVAQSVRIPTVAPAGGRFVLRDPLRALERHTQHEHRAKRRWHRTACWSGARRGQKRCCISVAMRRAVRHVVSTIQLLRLLLLCTGKQYSSTTSELQVWRPSKLGCHQGTRLGALTDTGDSGAKVRFSFPWYDGNTGGGSVAAAAAAAFFASTAAAGATADSSKASRRRRFTERLGAAAAAGSLADGFFVELHLPVLRPLVRCLECRFGCGVFWIHHRAAHSGQARATLEALQTGAASAV